MPTGKTHNSKPFPKQLILDSYNLKEFADDKILSLMKMA